MHNPALPLVVCRAHRAAMPRCRPSWSGCACGASTTCENVVPRTVLCRAMLCCILPCCCLAGSALPLTSCPGSGPQCVLPCSAYQHCLVPSPPLHSYVIGGNGGNAAAHAISKECAAQGVVCNVVGVPKSIDNDIQLVRRRT